MSHITVSLDFARFLTSVLPIAWDGLSLESRKMVSEKEYDTFVFNLLEFIHDPDDTSTETTPEAPTTPGETRCPICGAVDKNITETPSTTCFACGANL